MSTAELVLEGPAAGGGFVGRATDGRVIFVRHGLPGERVRAILTEEHPRWARADAIEIIERSPDRVDPPCPFAGPGRCGGCDYQHIELSTQRVIKLQLLEEQVRRVAGVDVDVDVTPGLLGGTGLGTRTRVRFGVGADGRLGLRRHRSHVLEPVDGCLLAVDRIRELRLSERTWPPGSDVEAVALSGSSTTSVLVTREKDGGEGPAPGEAGDGSAGLPQTTVVGGNSYRVSPGVFWQVHRAAPELLVAAVLDGLDLQPGDRVLDLYCGAGLFTKPIAQAVGPKGRVTGVEISAAATKDAEANLAGLPWAHVVTGPVTGPVVSEQATGCTHVVLDPPRRGLDKGALEALNANPSLRRVVSVSCDAATFARDLRLFLDAGWRLCGLQAFDVFEMTEHLETVSVMVRDR